MLLRIVGVTAAGQEMQKTYRSMSFSSGEFSGFSYLSGGSKFGNDLDKIEKIEISSDLIVVTPSKEVSGRSPYHFPNPEGGCVEAFREYVSSDEVLALVLSGP